ncbi:MAG: MFS transporter [Chloroflexi bacterium]|nr:MFS transporter [Chloroflexota bacterium]
MNIARLAARGFFGYQWVILVLAIAAQAANGSSSQAIPVLASFYQADLRISLAQVGLFTSTISLATLLCGIASGWITDRVGVRYVLPAGLAISGACTVALSVVPSFGFLIPLGFLAGIGTTLGGPAIGKSILYWFSPRSRATAMGVKQTGIPLCGALAAALLPPLAIAVNWRYAMMVLGIVVIATGVVYFALYRDSASVVPHETRKPPSLAGLRDVLLSKNNWLVAMLAMALVGAQFVVVTYLMLYLREVLLVSAAMAGGYLALVQMSGLGARVGWGFFSDFVLNGRRKAVFLSCGFISMSTLVLIGLLGAEVSPAVVVALMIGLGVSLVGWHGVWITVLTEFNAAEMAGTSMGFGATVTHIGAVGFPILFGLIVDATGAYHFAWYAMAALIFLGMLPYLFFLREKAAK